MNENLSIKIDADMSGFAEAMRKFGEACRQASIAFTDLLKPAVQDYLVALRRAIRTTTGPWYRRWYWQAAYASADRFPEWVAVE